jgi:putative iron-dependent peroxidase
LDGPRHRAPSTPGDLLFHVKATSLDYAFELAKRVLIALDGAVTVVDEVQGFKFFDNRDLMGFVDGTENPVGTVAINATSVGDEDPDFAGGSYVHVQKYLHDMSGWDALPVPEQERVIGRTKLEDIEMADDEKPANSHLALNVIEDADGNELKIVRHNMPFGELGKSEFGTYYIGYARTPRVTERMLRNMFIGDPPGNTDRILDFSTAVTGSMFFTPSADFLEDPPPLPDSAHEDASSAPPPNDGSLAIGSLKGTTQ